MEESFRVWIAGDIGVGKRSIVQRFVNGKKLSRITE